MITVERQEPRNSRIIRLVSVAAMHALAHHARLTAAFTNSDWSPSAWTLSAGGSVSLSLGSSALT